MLTVFAKAWNIFLKNVISIEFPYCVYEVTNLTILGKLTRTRTLKKVQTFLD